MRTHGVPNFPAPVDGHIQLQPGSGIDPSAPQFQAADRACQAWAPQSSPSGASATRVRSWPAFAAWLRQQATAGQFSGAVLVAKDGRPVMTRPDGFANLQRRIPNTLDTSFDIGSVGKTLTAVAIAQLAEQGRLSFNDPISKYLAGLPARLRDITIAQLLTHTSGLGDVFARWHPTTSPLDVSQLMKRIINEPPQFTPGSRFSYSNSGFVVLGAIIQAVSEQTYYDYVRDHVLAPAGMTHTGWYTLDQVPNMAHGYIPLQRPQADRFQDSHGAGGWGNPSGGAYSTVDDLLRFAQALLAHKLLSSAMTNTVLTGKVNTGRPGPAQVSKYGYGFEDEEVNRVRIIGHGGGAPGIEAQLRIYPTLGYTVVILANLDSAATPIYNQINQILAGDPHSRAAGVTGA
jgi:CubicO group peptidase (beta-lactamase class C family)